jgi:hypothetical protein
MFNENDSLQRKIRYFFAEIYIRYNIYAQNENFR